MSESSVKGIKHHTSANTLTNAVSFLATTLVQGWVNTAEVVRVVAVEGGGSGSHTGYVDVLPLVCQIDSQDRALNPATLYHLPYARVQGGVAALVIDPVPGDIGIAVFTKRDSSNVEPGQEDPVQPGSFRTFDQADGFYIGGFLNQAPEIFLELDQDGNATLTAPKSVTVNTPECTVECRTFTVNASQSAGINAPSWSFNTYDGTGTGKGTINADLEHNGTMNHNGHTSHTGNTTQSGSLTSSGDHKAGSISLQQHVHTGVQGGSGTTGGPR